MSESKFDVAIIAKSLNDLAAIGKINGYAVPDTEEALGDLTADAAALIGERAGANGEGFVANEERLAIFFNALSPQALKLIESNPDHISELVAREMARRAAQREAAELANVATEAKKNPEQGAGSRAASAATTRATPRV
jgi:hypothetical protein